MNAMIELINLTYHFVFWTFVRETMNEISSLGHRCSPTEDGKYFSSGSFSGPFTVMDCFQRLSQVRGRCNQ
jgi:hypothetical protein